MDHTLNKFKGVDLFDTKLMPKVKDLINKYSKDGSKKRRRRKPRKNGVKKLIAMYENRITAAKESIKPWEQFQERQQEKKSEEKLSIDSVCRLSH